MKFWKLLGWLGTSVFLIVLLVSWCVADRQPNATQDPNTEPARAPEFH
jgi:lipid-A-disaccharide synthase-like uncharacterized protein